MLSCQQGEVLKILEHRPGATVALVAVGGRVEKAVNYDYLTGSISCGDRVLLNVTAVHLGLGTGGYHFVMANLNTQGMVSREKGHLMKMRYTPMQAQVMAAEEEASPYHHFFGPASSLERTPVVIGSLHSMLAPIAAAVKERLGRACRVVYLMTDAAALPLWFSRLVVQLREHCLIEGTITCGQACGGDVEAINIYSGLLAAHYVLAADIVIATMGPGIAGTGTTWGHTGLEQGELVNAVNILGGRPVAAVRLSFADSRPRHQGLSHHTITALGRVALTPALLPFPPLTAAELRLVREQVATAGLERLHTLVLSPGTAGRELLESIEGVTTMGRGPEDDPAFFRAAAAAGEVAADLHSGKVQLHHFPDGRVLTGQQVEEGEQLLHPAAPEEAAPRKNNFSFHQPYLH